MSSSIRRWAVDGLHSLLARLGQSIPRFSSSTARCILTFNWMLIEQHDMRMNGANPPMERAM